MHFRNVHNKDRPRWRRVVLPREPHMLPALGKAQTAFRQSGRIDQDHRELRGSVQGQHENFDEDESSEESSQRKSWLGARGDLQHAVPCGYVDDDTGVGTITPRKRMHRVTHHQQNKSRRWRDGAISRPSSWPQPSSFSKFGVVRRGEPLR